MSVVGLTRLTTRKKNFGKQDGRKILTGHGQHILLAAGLELHLVHEVLDADLVEDTVRVDEQDEQIVITL